MSHAPGGDVRAKVSIPWGVRVGDSNPVLHVLSHFHLPIMPSSNWHQLCHDGGRTRGESRGVVRLSSARSCVTTDRTQRAIRSGLLGQSVKGTNCRNLLHSLKTSYRCSHPHGTRGLHHHKVAFRCLSNTARTVPRTGQ